MSLCRKMIIRGFRIALLALLTAFASSAALACSCLPWFPTELRMPEEMVFSDVVFQGRVLSVSGVPDTNWIWHPTFAVSKVWKGKVGKQIVIYNGFGCDESFWAGKEYIVFARFDPKVGWLRPTGCATPTREVKDAVLAGEWLDGSYLSGLLLSLTKTRVKILLAALVGGIVVTLWLKFFPA